MAAVKAAEEATTARIAAINEIGDKFGFKDDADKFAKEGKSVAEFREHITNKSPEDWKNSLEIRNPANGGQSGGEGSEDESDADDAVAQIKKSRRGN